MQIITFHKDHFPLVSQIYSEGLETGIATYETKVPTWEQWDDKFLKICRFVVLIDKKVVAWCALSAISKREAYKGVAEDTIYVSRAAQGRGIGKLLLSHLINESEKAGLWTLQAGIFSENKVSIKLHENCGFRIIGIREKIAKRDGKWHDNVLLERRSKNILYMKNVLVLCTGNSCRSQMAHGYLKHYAKDRAVIFSAGIETHGLNPKAVKTMKEDGIDISQHTSNNLTEYATIDFDYILTVCDHANENCPFIPSKNATRLHHNFSDPSKVIGTEKEISEAFIKTREQIKAYCLKFVKENL